MSEEGKSWKGTPPAQGTRRRLILDTIERFKTDHGNHPSSRELADAVESALLRSTIDGEEDRDLLRLPRALEIEAIGWISAELAARSGAWEGNAPDWFPEPPEWLELWDKALAAVRAVRGKIDKVDPITPPGVADKARAGEDTFKAQRDAALNLLRWLIGDLLPEPVGVDLDRVGRGLVEELRAAGVDFRSDV